MLLPSARPVGSASRRLPSEYEVPSSKQRLAWRQMARRSQASSRLDLHVLIPNVVLVPVVTVIIVTAVIADNIDVRIALGSDDGVILVRHIRGVIIVHGKGLVLHGEGLLSREEAAQDEEAAHGEELLL